MCKKEELLQLHAEYHIHDVDEMQKKNGVGRKWLLLLFLYMITVEFEMD